MKTLEKEQLFLEDLAEQKPEESLEHKPAAPQSSELGQDEEDCKVCGDSGPCSACERGRKLAKEQGNPYRRQKR